MIEVLDDGMIMRRERSGTKKRLAWLAVGGAFGLSTLGVAWLVSSLTSVDFYRATFAGLLGFLLLVDGWLLLDRQYRSWQAFASAFLHTAGLIVVVVSNSSPVQALAAVISIIAGLVLVRLSAIAVHKGLDRKASEEA